MWCIKYWSYCNKQVLGKNLNISLQFSAITQLCPTLGDRSMPGLPTITNYWSFQGKRFDIMVIQVYAPTSNAEGAEQFYEDL